MKWVKPGPLGHAVLPQDDVDDDGCDTVCGLRVDCDGAEETPSGAERPFGADTCPDCHRQLKAWMIDQATAPEGVMPVPVAAVTARAMSREERQAAIRGERPEPVSMPGDGAPAPRRAAVVPDDTGDVEGFEETPGAAVPTPAGVFVKPEKGGRRRKPANPRPDDIDN